MTTHVFIVNARTFKTHLEYLFAGTGAADKKVTFLLNHTSYMHHSTERNLTGMIADISRVRKGDNIIFYLQAHSGKPGRFYGIFKADSKAFLDDNDNSNYLREELGKALTFRILIKPSEVYSKGLTEHEYLDDLTGKNKPYEMCWSLIYRKLKANRGCTMITNYEFDDLEKKLRQKNSNAPLICQNYTFDEISGCITSSPTKKIYKGREQSIDIQNRLIYKETRNNSFETHLQAYILQHFDEPFFRKILGINDNQQLWIGNEVSCGVGMQRIDIMLQSESANESNIKIIELKDEEPSSDIITNQLPWYVEWVSYYLAPNSLNIGKSVSITPCIIAKQPNNFQLINSIKATQLSTPNFSTCSKITFLPTELITFTIQNNSLEFKRLF